MIRAVLSAVALSLALSGAAWAEPACRLPPDLAPWPVATPPADEIADVPVAFHLLAVSWAPAWCETNGRGSTSQRLDCDGPDRGFFLHGLWPNGRGKPYPRYCAPVGGIDPATVRRMYCRTPSAELLQHEWQAHGGCGWTEASVYFRQAARLFDRLKMPRLETIPTSTLTAGAVRRAFVVRNPWLRPDMIMVAADKQGRFAEVRLCHDLKFRPAGCPGGAAPADDTPLRLPPSRTGRF